MIILVQTELYCWVWLIVVQFSSATTEMCLDQSVSMALRRDCALQLLEDALNVPEAAGTVMSDAAWLVIPEAGWLVRMMAAVPVTSEVI